MAFRVTTNGMYRAYKSTLIRTNNKLQRSMENVSTHRAFSSYAEDPSSASKAFQLRRNMWRTEDQISNSNYLIAKFETGYNAMAFIVDGTEEKPGLDGLVDALSGITATAGQARNALGQSLVAKAESIALDMNVSYSEDFVFAGNDGLNAPFTWDGDRLLYRGVDVSASEETDPEAYSKLQAMNGEKSFVDIGLGMQEDSDGKLIESSAFNGSFSGLSFLNYGLDEDGDPKNLAVLMRQLGKLFLNTGDNGEFPSKEAEQTANRMVDKLKNAVNYAQEQHVRMSADASYLRTNLNQLTDTRYTLNEEIDSLEQQDPANAIMDMYWAQYCYQASLRIGNDLLSQSLFDFMS